MFGKKQDEIDRLKSEVDQLHQSARRARQDLNELAMRNRKLEDRVGKVRVKVVDEDGEPIMLQRHPAQQPRQDSTYVAIEDVLGSVFEHLGLDFSIERRDPELIRIEDEPVDFIIMSQKDSEE